MSYSAQLVRHIDWTASLYSRDDEKPLSAAEADDAIVRRYTGHLATQPFTEGSDRPRREGNRGRGTCRETGRDLRRREGCPEI
jgi:hypothetical protein